MNIEVNYQIADLKRSRGKDDRNGYGNYNDLSYTDDNMNLIFSDIMGNAKVSKKQTDYDFMKKVFPKTAEIKKEVARIDKFYEDNFAYNLSDKNYILKLRFYLHVGTRTVNGDYSAGEISIMA